MGTITDNQRFIVKQTLIDMMLDMMPYMFPLFWAGVAVAALGVALAIAGAIFKANTSRIALLFARTTFAVSLFFLAAQLVGFLLSMPPKLNFGDKTQMEFILVHFWQIGLGFLVAALVIKLLNFKKPAPAG